MSLILGKIKYMATSVKKSFPVTGLSCASCAISVESMLKSRQDVIDANVNYAASTVLIEYVPSTGILDEFKKSVQSIGYDLIIESDQSSRLEEQKQNASTILKYKTIWASVLTIPI